MRLLILTLMVVFLISISAAESRHRLSCYLHCMEFICDVRSLPKEVAQRNDKFFCNNSISNKKDLCFKSGSSLQVSFHGFSCAVYQPLRIFYGNQEVFNEKPCVFERAYFHVNVSETGVQIKRLSTDHCHYEESVILSIKCEDEHGFLVKQVFKPSKNESKMKALRPGRLYNCSIQYRIEEEGFISACGVSVCPSVWSNPTNQVFRTRVARPSAPPVPLSFLKENKMCHVYYLPVPKFHRNGVIRSYRISCEDNPVLNQTSGFKFVLDCHRLPLNCALDARTDAGFSVEKARFKISTTDRLPELVLWAGQNRDEWWPEVRFPGRFQSNDSFLLICRCVDCRERRPDCIDLVKVELRENRPPPMFNVSLSTHKIAVLPKSTALPMSEWINCVSTASSAQKPRRTLRAVARRDVVLNSKGERLLVEIDAVFLQCPRSARPIDVIISRFVCPDRSPEYETHERLVGTETLKFDLRIRPNCEIFLSEDNSTFFAIYPVRASNAEHVIHLVIGSVAGMILIFVMSIIILKKRRTCLGFTDKLCYDPVQGQNRHLPMQNLQLKVDSDGDPYDSYDTTLMYSSITGNVTTPIRDQRSASDESISDSRSYISN